MECRRLPSTPAAMQPEWIDPKAISVAVVLAAGIGLFLYGRVMPTSQCDKQLASKDESHQRTIAAYELRIVELTKDRDDYKSMVRTALEGLNRTLDAKGAPGKDRL